MGQAPRVNGTVHLCHAGPDANICDLDLPLYRYKHEMESASKDKTERCAIMVPLPEVARFIWHRYGINLIALGSLEFAGMKLPDWDSFPPKLQLLPHDRGQNTRL